MAKYIWVKVNIMRHILSFLTKPFFRLTCKKRLAIPKKFLVIEIALFQIFSMLQWSEKILTMTNKLEFIGILQLSKAHLRLEINFSTEIKKTIAKKLSWNFHVLIWKHLFYYNCIRTFVQSFFEHNNVICNLLQSCNHPTHFALALVPVLCCKAPH